MIGIIEQGGSLHVESSTAGAELIAEIIEGKLTEAMTNPVFINQHR